MFDSNFKHKIKSDLTSVSLGNEMLFHGNRTSRLMELGIERYGRAFFTAFLIKWNIKQRTYFIRTVCVIQVTSILDRISNAISCNKANSVIYVS